MVELRIAIIGMLGTLLSAGIAAQAPDDPQHQLFETSDKCLACHNGLVTASGEDVSIGLDWITSIMAHSARDPYWQAAVRREVMEHPQAKARIEDECSACHMPMSRYLARARGGKGQIFTHLPFTPAGGRLGVLAEDGVSCTVCHQITAENLGKPASYTGGFNIDIAKPLGERPIYGPFKVKTGHQRIMRSASGFQPQQGRHIQNSELCATCHTLYTHTLGPEGQAIAELPEQVPYLEWRHSNYAEKRSCQNCHMPVVEQEMPITSVLGEPRKGFSRHEFRGGNFFMLRMLNRYRDELAVEAGPQALDTAAQRTIEHLKSSTARLALAEVEVQVGALHVVVAVENLAGHKLPTAYPSRRAWIHLRVRNRQGEVVFESGRFTDQGAIVGNDNDTDPNLFEPHYRTIDSPDKVQIYESIMADPEGNVTTGLLRGIRFIKDNRLLPRGFDKATAPRDVAVQGAAADDGDFRGGGDRVRYRIPVATGDGPFHIQAELWYQPIAYRWAHNLERFPAAETNRFVRFYNAMADASAVVLARAAATTP